MQFLANTWWLLLAVGLILAVTAGILQARSLRRVAKDGLSGVGSFLENLGHERTDVGQGVSIFAAEPSSSTFRDASDAFDTTFSKTAGGFFSRFKAPVICGILAVCCFLLGIVGIVADVIQFSKNVA